jgi:hypothetical protein
MPVERLGERGIRVRVVAERVERHVAEIAVTATDREGDVDAVPQGLIPDLVANVDDRPFVWTKLSRRQRTIWRV